MEDYRGAKIPTMNLPIFTTPPEFVVSGSSPRSYADGVVGLGIVAAMTDYSRNKSGDEGQLYPKSTFSSPIPIFSSAKPRGGVDSESVCDEIDELSEDYTCVISHFGDESSKKLVYFDGRVSEIENRRVYRGSMDVDEVGGDNFLKSCFLCNKQLHGLDIFMYRGERAFCSAECRQKHMRTDDRKEKCGSEARKQVEYSVSPCSGPSVFFTGVLAA